MPRKETVLVVFASSPSEMEQERERLEKVIRELNQTWSRTLGVRLDLIRWETHGYPGFGEDPQDVLNRELPDDSDIFVGLMWGRFGTPTRQAGSGTEEEFLRALARYREDESTVKIMFYFKDAPIPPSEIDPKQLARVQQFRSSLGDAGGLYWAFVKLEEFEELIRIHLTRQIQEFVQDQPKEIQHTPIVKKEQSDVAVENDDELGFIDYLDIMDDKFAALNDISERIANETTALGERMRRRTDDIESAVSSAREQQLNRKEARTLINRAASDLNAYVARMKAEIPLFDQHLRQGTEAAGHATLMSLEFTTKDDSRARETKLAMQDLEDALCGAYDATASMRDSIQAWPRMTSVLNRARREAVKVLDEILRSFSFGRTAIKEIIRTLDKVPESKDSS